MGVEGDRRRRGAAGTARQQGTARRATRQPDRDEAPALGELFFDRRRHLADAALVSRSRLTHRVDRMVSKGLVEREACPTDGRGTFAVLTAEGRRTIVAAAPTHVEGVRRYVVDAVPPDELDALGQAMGTVTAAVCRYE